jgi:positive regulator of sigma E activity
MQISEKEKKELMLACAVVVLSIIAIASAALFGFSNIIFYVSAILAIALGFFMSYSLTKEGSGAQQSEPVQRAARKARARQ